MILFPPFNLTTTVHTFPHQFTNALNLFPGFLLVAVETRWAVECSPTISTLEDSFLWTWCWGVAHANVFTHVCFSVLVAVVTVFAKVTTSKKSCDRCDAVVMSIVVINMYHFTSVSYRRVFK